MIKLIRKLTKFAWRDFLFAASRVEYKYGRNEDGKPSDWTEWTDLRENLNEIGCLREVHEVKKAVIKPVSLKVIEEFREAGKKDSLLQRLRESTLKAIEDNKPIQEATNKSVEEKFDKFAFDLKYKLLEKSSRGNWSYTFSKEDMDFLGFERYLLSAVMSSYAYRLLRDFAIKEKLKLYIWLGEGYSGIPEVAIKLTWNIRIDDQ